MGFEAANSDPQISDITWLQPPGSSGKKQCQSDSAKRREMFLEFLYYVFDSLLIPLLRNSFYITESNTDRNQLFYFRHDVWRHIAEPAFSTLRQGMLEEVKTEAAVSILGSRQLGFSQLRLLPKGEKLRPIMNLRRRMIGVGRGKLTTLTSSINMVLSPVHTMLKYEKVIVLPFRCIDIVLTPLRILIDLYWGLRCSLSMRYIPGSSNSRPRSATRGGHFTSSKWTYSQLLIRYHKLLS